MKIDALEEFGDAFGAMLAKNIEMDDIITNSKCMVEKLVSEKGWLQPVLSNLVLDEAFLKSQWQSIDANEIQIYRSKDKAFSVRAYIWEPNVVYPIHDHGAWGIVGAYINNVTERKFKRLDDGKNDNYAELKKISENVLAPGETTVVLPLDDGIHQMQATDDLTSVTIHVYGSPVRKGYIHYFDMQSKWAQRMYPPSINKKIFAIKSLGSIPESWAEETLCKSIKSDIPGYVKNECNEALEKLRSL